MVVICMERYLLCFPPTVLSFFSDRPKELQEVSAARKNKSTGGRRRGRMKEEERVRVVVVGYCEQRKSVRPDAEG